MTEKTKQNFLARHLRSRGKHLGRSNPEMLRIAEHAMLSIHTIQSMAMGRKPMTDAQKELIRDAIASGR